MAKPPPVPPWLLLAAEVGRFSPCGLTKGFVGPWIGERGGEGEGEGELSVSLEVDMSLMGKRDQEGRDSREE